MFARCCPTCSGTITDADINYTTEIAFCRVCNVSLEFKELRRTLVLKPGANLDYRPPGTWYHDTGGQVVIGASCRSIPRALAAGVTALMWNAPVSLFLFVAVLATLDVAGVRLPDWIPIQLREIAARTGACPLVFMWLILLPFMWIGLLMLVETASCIGGVLEITFDDAGGCLTEVIAGIGRRRPFNPHGVKDVWVEQVRHRGRKRGRYSRHILLEMTEGKSIAFGKYLRDDRRDFLTAALNAALRRKPEGTGIRGVVK